MTTKITRSEMLAEEMTRFCLDKIMDEKVYRLLEIDFKTSMLHIGSPERIILVEGHILTTKGEGTFEGNMRISRSADNSWQPTQLYLKFDSPVRSGHIRYECGYDDPKSASRKLIIKKPAL